MTRSSLVKLWQVYGQQEQENGDTIYDVGFSVSNASEDATHKTRHSVVVPIRVSPNESADDVISAYAQTNGWLE
jgi:hypothetical protein